MHAHRMHVRAYDTDVPVSLAFVRLCVAEPKNRGGLIRLFDLLIGPAGLASLWKHLATLAVAMTPRSIRRAHLRMEGIPRSRVSLHHSRSRGLTDRSIQSSAGPGHLQRLERLFHTRGGDPGDPGWPVAVGNIRSLSKKTPCGQPWLITALLQLSTCCVRLLCPRTQLVVVGTPSG